jgi:hypothetical protein
MNDQRSFYAALLVSRTGDFVPDQAGMTAFNMTFDDDNDGRLYEVGDDALGICQRCAGTTLAGDQYVAIAQTAGVMDTSDGGTNDVRGAASTSESSLVFEIAHPLDTLDNAHDFSLRAGAHVGVTAAVTVCDEQCVDRTTFWPSPESKADFAVFRTPRAAQVGEIERAWMSLPAERRAVSRVSRTKGLQANYLFRVPPVAGSGIRVTWHRDRKLVGTVSKSPSRQITSLIYGGDYLSPGLYRAVLSVRPPGYRYVPVAAASARVG